MSLKDKTKAMVGRTILERSSGERPSVVRATAGAAVVGGVTTVVVFDSCARPTRTEAPWMRHNTI